MLGTRGNENILDSIFLKCKYFQTAKNSVFADLSQKSQPQVKQKHLVFSSTEVYFTFYTRGLTVGNKYNLKLTDIERSMDTEFTEALEIVNGVQGALKMQIDSQARLLVGETGTITVSVQNSGDTDIVGPIMVMEVSGVQIFVFR